MLLHRSSLALMAFVALTLIGLVSFAVDIENFAIPNPPLFWEMSDLRVGPDGGVWFSCGTGPPRLMRASADGIECITDHGYRQGFLVRLAFAPDGTLWLWQKTGGLWGDVELYTYDEERGVLLSDLEVPPGGSSSQAWSHEVFFDIDNRVYCRVEDTDMVYYKYSWLYELTADGPIKLYEELNGLINSPLLVTRRECLVGLNAGYGWKTGLYQIDLNTGGEALRCSTDESWRDGEIYPAAMDSEGAIWFNWGPCIASFRNGRFSELASGIEYELEWSTPRLTADGTVWATKNATEDSGERDSVGRFRGGVLREFTQDDGLLTDDYGETVIDYDGAVWVINYQGSYVRALSRVTDGGQPPMRITLRANDAAERVAVVASVLNNGPAVGVDVYIAIYLHGMLLYYPYWLPEPYPVQLNLQPGFFSTGTIIEERKSEVPPGTYTFYAAMAGRGADNYIGPIGGKVQSVTIQLP